MMCTMIKKHNVNMQYNGMENQFRYFLSIIE